MYRFLVRLLLFFCCFAAAVLAINYFGNNPEDDITFMASLIDKHQKLESVEGPKVILAGGSNTAFGFDSELMESKLQVPVVNLGLHAGLGLSFMLNQLKDVITEDDMVLLSLEYFIDLEGTHSLKQSASNYYPLAAKYYDTDIYENLTVYAEASRLKYKDIIATVFPKDSTEAEKRQARNGRVPSYSREAFNSYGDVVAHLEKPPSRPLRSRKVHQYKYWDGIDEINAFHDYAKSKNVIVYFLFPTLAASEVERNKNSLDQNEADIIANLNCQVLNRVTDLSYPDEYYYDTVYHLNKTGREIRTLNVIESLLRNKDAVAGLNKIRE